MRFEYGAGDRPTAGYTTVDICGTADIQLPFIDAVLIDAVFNPVCAPGRASEILSVHFVEHFSRAHVRRLTATWFVMLRNGGRLITCFPDLSMMARQVIDSGELPSRPLLKHVFGAVVEPERQELFRHRSFWTADEFMQLLLDVGFKSALQVPYTRPYHNRLWTAEVIATK